MEEETRQADTHRSVAFCNYGFTGAGNFGC